MYLLVIVLIAIVLGYWLGHNKAVDQVTTRTESWRDRLRRRPAEASVVDAEAHEPEAESAAKPVE